MNLSKLPFLNGWVCLLPDTHAGMGMPIGGVVAAEDVLIPNAVGVDIGCGMETVRIRETHLELQKLDKLIYEKIPSGFSIRTKAHRSFSRIDLSQLCCAKQVDLIRAEKSIGTLGGGNARHRPHHAAHHGLPGGHPHRGGHPVQGGG